jgi:hypothetical protein
MTSIVGVMLGTFQLLCQTERIGLIGSMRRMNGRRSELKCAIRDLRGFEKPMAGGFLAQMRFCRAKFTLLQLDWHGAYL